MASWPGATLRLARPPRWVGSPARVRRQARPTLDPRAKPVQTGTRDGRAGGDPRATAQRSASCRRHVASRKGRPGHCGTSCFEHEPSEAVWERNDRGHSFHLSRRPCRRGGRETRRPEDSLPEVQASRSRASRAPQPTAAANATAAHRWPGGGSPVVAIRAQSRGRAGHRRAGGCPRRGRTLWQGDRDGGASDHRRQRPQAASPRPADDGFAIGSPIGPTASPASGFAGGSAAVAGPARAGGGSGRANPAGRDAGRSRRGERFQPGRAGRCRRCSGGDFTGRHGAGGGRPR